MKVKLVWHEWYPWISLLDKGVPKYKKIGKLVEVDSEMVKRLEALNKEAKEVQAHFLDLIAISDSKDLGV